MIFSKKIKLIILILMCSTTFFIYKYTNFNNINYTVMGDGLSYGIDSYGRKAYGYADYIKDYFAEKNKLKCYSNEYTKEEMTIEMLTNAVLSNQKVDSKTKTKNIKTLLSETDYLTMSIGMNDLLYKLSVTDNLNESNLNQIMKEIETSFNYLISEIRKVYNREIYIIGYYDFNIENKIYNLAVRKLNNIYKKNKHVTYISTSIISQNQDIFLSNKANYYPNYKGYRVISNKIIDKIEKKLEK